MMLPQGLISGNISGMSSINSRRGNQITAAAAAPPLLCVTTNKFAICVNSNFTQNRCNSTTGIIHQLYTSSNSLRVHEVNHRTRTAGWLAFLKSYLTVIKLLSLLWTAG